eukprot:6053821-Lingulodinium_polyedra.AAC.1
MIHAPPKPAGMRPTRTPRGRNGRAITWPLLNLLSVVVDAASPQTGGLLHHKRAASPQSQTPCASSSSHS